MSRENKFGYGFLLAGIGMPYLIERLLGPTPATVVSIICVVLGIAFLVAGHRHEKPMTRIGIAIVIICLLGTGGTVWYLWQPKKPPDHPPTLSELFKSDFSNLLSRKWTFSWKEGSGAQITAYLYLDFAEKNKFVAFYVPTPLPKPERTYDACIELADSVMSIVSDQSLHIWGGRYNSMSDMDDLKFAGLVYLYHEWPLSNPQKAAIIEAYQAKHFDVEFRGPDYELQVDTRWHLDHDAKPRSAP